MTTWREKNPPWKNSPIYWVNMMSSALMSRRGEHRLMTLGNHSSSQLHKGASQNRGPPTLSTECGRTLSRGCRRCLLPKAMHFIIKLIKFNRSLLGLGGPPPDATFPYWLLLVSTMCCEQRVKNWHFNDMHNAHGLSQAVQFGIEYYSWTITLLKID